MKYLIILFLSLEVHSVYSQEMAKTFIMKKSHDTMWSTKSEYIFKTKKHMSGQNDLSVMCSKNAHRSGYVLWLSGSFYARVIFTVKKDDKTDIVFTDGSTDSLFAESDQQSGVGSFNEKTTSWFTTFLLSEDQLKVLSTKDIASLVVKAGPYYFNFTIDPSKKDIIKNQLLLLVSKTRKQDSN